MHVRNEAICPFKSTNIAFVSKRGFTIYHAVRIQSEQLFMQEYRYSELKITP